MVEKPIPEEATKTPVKILDPEKGYDSHAAGSAKFFDPDRIKEAKENILYRHAKNMSPEELKKIKDARERLKKFGL